MADPFDDFQREMLRRTMRAARDNADNLAYASAINSKPGLSEQDQRDRALISAMHSYPLKRGQMLLLGPQSVRILSTPGAFAGVLPDKLVLERSEWCPGKT